MPYSLSFGEVGSNYCCDSDDDSFRDGAAYFNAQPSSYLTVFLGILGFGLSIIFCTTFCRACSRIREEQIRREAWRRSEQQGPPQSIYFIPFPRSLSRQDSEDQHGSVEIRTPPRYSTAVYCGPPPSYNELNLKPEDLPPAYSDQSVPVYSIAPSPHAEPPQTQTQSHP